jgi:hypothetical protein
MTHFTEGFELVISGQDDEQYDWQKEEYRPEYFEKISVVLSELGISKEQIKTEGTNVGVGAAGEAVAWTILAGLTILYAGKRIFLAGKTINENVDAWIELSKKLRTVRRRLNLPTYHSLLPPHLH